MNRHKIGFHWSTSSPTSKISVFPKTKRVLTRNINGLTNRLMAQFCKS